MVGNIITINVIEAYLISFTIPELDCNELKEWVLDGKSGWSYADTRYQHLCVDPKTDEVQEN